MEMGSPRSSPSSSSGVRRISIRRASVTDSEDVARVCLMTAYQGRSAEALVRHPELPSQVRALPYLHLPSGFGFVLVETAERPDSEADTDSDTETDTETESGESRIESDVGREAIPDFEVESSRQRHLLDCECENENETRTRPQLHRESRDVVLGYVVGTPQTAQFEREVSTSWWPTLRTRYPKDLVGTPLDRYFIGLIHKGAKISPAGSSGTGGAHMHVSVIGKYKKLGYDRLLVDVALQHLRRRDMGKEWRSRI